MPWNLQVGIGLTEAIKPEIRRREFNIGPTDKQTEPNRRTIECASKINVKKHERKSNLSELVAAAPKSARLGWASAVLNADEVEASSGE